MSGSVLVISAGIGSPAECEMAVTKMLEYIQRLHKTEVLEYSEGRSGYLRSVMLTSEEDLSAYAGDIQWRCPSPLRPGHKRKNWFIRSSFCSMKEKGGEFQENLVLFETCRSGGPGGQHVNKVESAVRATYPPLGLTTLCSDERSQHANKKRAIHRLRAMAAMHAAEMDAEKKEAVWRQKGIIARGGETHVFTGLDFRPL